MTSILFNGTNIKRFVKTQDNCPEFFYLKSPDYFVHDFVQLMHSMVTDSQTMLKVKYAIEGFPVSLKGGLKRRIK